MKAIGGSFQMCADDNFLASSCLELDLWMHRFEAGVSIWILGYNDMTGWCDITMKIFMYNDDFE